MSVESVLMVVFGGERAGAKAGVYKDLELN